MTALVSAVMAGASVFPAAADEASAVDGVAVDPSSQMVTVESGDVGLQLPGDLTTTEVDTSLISDDVFSGQGASLLNTTVESAVLSSYATEDGVQTLIQIADADAPTEYRFPLSLPEGGQAALFDDGAVIVSDASGAAVSGFRAPWAVDANGTAVPTSFRVDGNELVQVVAFTADTAFPVTADPDLGTEWWGYYVQLTRAETKKVATIIANNQGPAALAGVVCGALPAPPAVVACGAAIALAYFSIVDPINRANNAGKCAAINYPWLVISNPQIGWTSINVTTVNCRR
ncbi:hypothetical protein [Microbacterium oxydans]|uniref:hypothetical protein n=1 Tax=Microbacterium oxydans TaxID=82380 RepID=UPI0022B1C659|nr:hypothetical protein [Microbacterium oxydans]MCZ4302465.1 hypothetical protein [Microbacterium oxydans]